ncbi:MAG: flagellar biosynthetic protein FliO [Thermoleophilia bacterium]
MAGWALAIAAWLTALVLAAAPAMAATATTTAPADPEDLPIPEGSAAPTSLSGDGGGTLLRLGVGLVVVVGLIALVWFVMKKLQRSRYPALEEKGPDLIDVVTTTSLGPNRALHLVRVGEELVLVGSTDQAITGLARLGVEESAALVDLAPPSARFGTGSATPGGPGVDDRARAVATANEGSLVERLRALTTRR